KLNLFVRLWRKTGWSIENVDHALRVFIPVNASFDRAHLPLQPLQTALIYMAHLKALDETLDLGDESRIKLLTFWSDVPISGTNPLYEQLFLIGNAHHRDVAFDDPLGNYLSSNDQFITGHLPALQSALGLTLDEISMIIKVEGGKIDDASLSLANVSSLYRYSLLARGVHLSVSDLISLRRLSGIDPFTPLSKEPLADSSSRANRTNASEFDSPLKSTLPFVEMAMQVAASGFTIKELEYLLRHQFDPIGTYSPNRPAMVALLT